MNIQSILFALIYLQESWSDKLRTRFYNIRRQPKLQKLGLEVKTSKPPKRCKTINNLHHATALLSQSLPNTQDMGKYKRNIQAMKKMKPSETSSKTAQFLMKETIQLRQKWIQENLPIVKDIITEFPLLKSYTNVGIHYVFNTKHVVLTYS